MTQNTDSNQIKFEYSKISNVHLEISTLCNASCPLCPRNIAGFDADLGYPLHNMTVAEAQTIFTEKFLNQLDTILINGNFGDFVMNPHGLDIVRYFVSVNPNIKIEISTNGAARHWWNELGKIPNVTVGFALDGLEDVHKLYRRNTNWNTVIKNAKEFIAAGGTAIWRMIKFDFNQHQIEHCRLLSKQLGFKDFSISFDGRDRGPVYNKNGEYEYKIGPAPDFTSEPYPKNIVGWVDWTVPGAMPHKRNEEYKTIPIKTKISCYSLIKKEIYITATGEVYPCCWLGFYPHLPFKHSWQHDNHQIDKIATSNNALEVGIERAVEWFVNVRESWRIKTSYADGRLFKCDQNCGH